MKKNTKIINHENERATGNSEGKKVKVCGIIPYLEKHLTNALGEFMDSNSMTEMA